MSISPIQMLPAKSSRPAIPWGHNGLGEIVYLRTYARDIEGDERKEHWPETIERIMRGTREINTRLTSNEEDRLAEHMLALRGTVSGRALWMLGTPFVRKTGMDSLVNCWFTSITKPDDFGWIMDRLMVGGGVGFSVERANVYQFPPVLKTIVRHDRSNDADYIVPDNREGWSELIERIVTAHFSGHGFSYSTIVLRPSGAPLKTFGGTSSGPTALIDGAAEICRVICARAGKRLRSVDILDIANIIGRIVVAGSARRSAEIALGDPDDALFLRAKRWADGTIPAWRQNSNNTLVVDNFKEIAEDAAFWRNFDGGSEPYGLFNRRLARTMGRLGERRADPTVEGINPCGEAQLSNRESCNLATIWLPNVRDFDEFREISTILYKIQKAVALLPHPDPATAAIVHRNLRLGQSVTGILQATPEQREWLSPGYEALRATDKEWSKKLRVRESIRLTVVQPGGTLSILPGVTSGIHPAYSQRFIRRVRFGTSDPLVEACRQHGYPVVTEIGLDGRPDHSRWVVEFPCEVPEGTLVASTMSAEDQLGWASWAQKNWADQAVSVTITYRDKELPAIRSWLAEHYDHEVKSVSFLRYSDHGFALAPYEPIDKEEYDRRVARLKGGEVTLVGNSSLEDDDCETGACPVR
jgi:hypothetical protein